MHKLLKQAFTLIELLVVIAIIGILSGLIIVGMNGTTQKATIAKAQVFSNSLRNSLMMNIVGEWKFDGATSERPAVNADVVDSWGGVNNGTIPASPSIPTIKTASNCVGGSCLSFDGVDDYVTVNDNASLKIVGDLTISAWIKLANTSGYKWIVCKDYTGEYCFGITNNELRFYNGDGGYEAGNSSGSNLSTNWTHVMIVRTSSSKNVDFYVNGSYVSSWNYTKTIVSGSYNIFIGTRNDFYTYFTGSIDDVRIYNSAMPTSYIQEQYCAGLNSLLSSGQINAEEYSQRINSIAKE